MFKKPVLRSSTVLRSFMRSRISEVGLFILSCISFNLFICAEVRTIQNITKITQQVNLEDYVHYKVTSISNGRHKLIHVYKIKSSTDNKWVYHVSEKRPWIKPKEEFKKVEKAYKLSQLNNNYLYD